MKAVLRRAEPGGDDDCSRSATSCVQRARREVVVAGETVELRPKEFDLLAYLIAEPRRVLSRDAAARAGLGLRLRRRNADG